MNIRIIFCVAIIRLDLSYLKSIAAGSADYAVMSVACRSGGGYTEDISPAILHASLGDRSAALLLLLVQLLEVFAFVLFGELWRERLVQTKSQNLS